MYKKLSILVVLATNTFAASITTSTTESHVISTDGYRKDQMQYSSTHSPTTLSSKNSGYNPSQVETPRLPLSSELRVPTYPDYQLSSNYSAEDYADHQINNNHAITPSPPVPRFTGWLSVMASRLIPFGNLALAYGARAIVFIFQLSVVSVIGLILTTSLCTFTPLCTISFAGLDISKNQVKQQVSELAREYITQENLDAATEFAMRAFQKYSARQYQRK